MNHVWYQSCVVGIKPTFGLIACLEVQCALLSLVQLSLTLCVTLQAQASS